MAAALEPTHLATETVAHKTTVNAARLGELPEVNPVHVATLPTGAEQRDASGPVEPNYATDEICTNRANGFTSRTGSVRTPGRSTPTPSQCNPHRVTPEARAAAADHFERRARALIANGVAEDIAITKASEEALECTRRATWLARQTHARVELLDAYQGNTYQLLRDLGDHLSASLAYIDRDTIEAHLERVLSDDEWAATNDQFTALDFDDHVGDHGIFRTDWIESLLDRAGVPGYGHTADTEDAVITGAPHNPQGGTAA